MERKRTKFTGVYQREHSSRRHNGRPDVCYDITYKSPQGKKLWEKVGWASEGYTAQTASGVRNERLQQQRHGDMPQIVTKRGKSLSFAEAFAAYEKDWLCQVKTSAEDIRRFHAYLEPLHALRLDSISVLDLERLKSTMSKTYSPQTIRHAIGLVRRVYRKVSAWGLYRGQIPTDKVSMPSVSAAARTRYLTREEAKTLLTALKRRSPQWHDIALMSLHTGMRLGEILTLRWEDVDLGNRHLYVRDAKAGSRVAMVTEEATAMLEARRMPHGLVFPSRGDVNRASFKASKTFFIVVEEVGLNNGITDRRQRVVFHTLRHTFASWLAIEGVPLYVIGELLGHKTLEMTKRYSHLCPDAKKAAINVIDGGGK